MEWFWISAPFLAFFSIILSVYMQKKDSKKDKQVLNSFKNNKDSPLKSLLIRAGQRDSSVLFGIIAYISLIFVFFDVYEYVRVGTVVSLKDMEVQSGVVVDVISRKKAANIIVLKTKDGNQEFIGGYSAKKMKIKMLNQRAKVWYQKRDGLFTQENEIQQLYINDKPYNRNSKFWTYDYNYEIEDKESTLTSIINTFYIIVICTVIVLFLSRKEMPIHRLNRMKANKKRRGE